MAWRSPTTNSVPPTPARRSCWCTASRPIATRIGNAWAGTTPSRAKACAASPWTAVAAAVQGEAAQAFARDGVVPAHAFPILVAIGREAVHQHDRLAGVGGTEFVVGERQAIGRELSHNFP